MIVLLTLTVLVGCTPLNETPNAGAEPAAHRAWLVADGWHSGIILNRAEAAAMIPEAADFPGARYLEFGWGDRDYYMAEEPTAGMALRAALTPTPAVLHVQGRSELPSATRKWQVIRLDLTGAQVRSLTAAISRSFARSDRSRVAPLGPGLTRNSRFYPAEGAFTLINTCNTWTARMLRAAGFRIFPRRVVTSADLLSQLPAN